MYNKSNNEVYRSIAKCTANPGFEPVAIQRKGECFTPEVNGIFSPQTVYFLTL